MIFNVILKILPEMRLKVIILLGPEITLCILEIFSKADTHVEK